MGAGLILLFGATTLFVGTRLLEKKYDLSLPDTGYSTASGDLCNVAVIPLTGEIWGSEADAQAQTTADGSSNTSAENVLAEIERAKSDPDIKGVLLRVDSPGGSPVGGERIANALKNLGKPSVAVMWDQGDSAAYLASTGADEIIASPMSEVGDIGVTSSFLDQSGENTRNGDTFIQISAGRYKDAGNPNKPLTSDEKALLQQEVNTTFQVFVQEVAHNRSLAVDAVQKVANGAGVLGADAVKTGLIDGVGDDSQAIDWSQTKMKEVPVLCDEHTS